jgi:hypothetical protein
MTVARLNPMAADKSDGANRPFKDLDRLLKKSGVRLAGDASQRRGDYQGLLHDRPD